jgi:hypothetical protein
MAEKRVVCINKAPTHDDTHHHITHIGTGSDAGYSERLPVATVIANVKSADGDRYYFLGANNAKSWVIVKQCRAARRRTRSFRLQQIIQKLTIFCICQSVSCKKQ